MLKIECQRSHDENAKRGWAGTTALRLTWILSIVLLIDSCEILLMYFCGRQSSRQAAEFGARLLCKGAKPPFLLFRHSFLPLDFQNFQNCSQINSAYGRVISLPYTKQYDVERKTIPALPRRYIFTTEKRDRGHFGNQQFWVFVLKKRVKATGKEDTERCISLIQAIFLRKRTKANWGRCDPPHRQEKQTPRTLSSRDS